MSTRNLTPAQRRDRFWRIFAITVAVMMTLAGLAMVAALLLFVVAMNSWGSNK